MSNKIQNYINHIVFVIDKSASMRELRRDVVKVFDGQIAHLAKRSQEINQETRVSVYVFDDDVECLIYDMDVMRLPSLANHYETGGNTALIAAVIKATEELKLTPEIHADHAFLIYTLTDGYENASRRLGKHASDLQSLMQNAANNYTFACCVPDSNGRQSAIDFGFSPNNTQIWSMTSTGITEVGETMKQATDNYMTARVSGQRSTKNLFHMDTTALNTKVIKAALVQLKPTEFVLLPVKQIAEIRPYVEKTTRKPYRKGSAFYQLTKPEKLQNYKQICVQEKTTAKVYSGTNARQILGLPDFEVKVSPTQHDKYNIFIQSCSVNRKLVPGTQLIVLK